MDYPALQFDPSFIEEAVFLNINALTDKKDFLAGFHQEREEIYAGDLFGEERERKFRALYKKYFIEMGLENIFKEIVSEFPLLRRQPQRLESGLGRSADLRRSVGATKNKKLPTSVGGASLSQPNILVFIRRVWSKKQEESELYIQGDLKTVYIGLQVIRMLEVGSLKLYLRQELLRVSDMLDPQFEYSPQVHLSGKNEIEDNLIRDRFHLLWDIYITSRLKAVENITIVSQQKQKDDLNKAFSFLDKSCQHKLFEEIITGDHFRQVDLLKFASQKNTAGAFKDKGLSCSLCDFTSYEMIGSWEGENKLVAQAIKNDYPWWKSSMNVCLQCFDMYYAKLKINPDFALAKSARRADWSNLPKI